MDGDKENTIEFDTLEIFLKELDHVINLNTILLFFKLTFFSMLDSEG